MDWRAVWWGVSRDWSELWTFPPIGWVIAVILVGLPLGSAIAIARGSRLAFVPLGVAAVILATDVWYYGTGWWPNPGLNGAMILVLVAMVGWLVLVLAFWRLRTSQKNSVSVTR